MSRFYLARWEPHQPDGDWESYRPSGVGQEFTAIDLHPPGIPDQRLGSRCLLWTPDPVVSVGAIDLGEDLDERMPRSVSQLLENALGLTLDSTDRLRSIIAELLLLHGRSPHDKSRWNPLRPDRRGINRIYLGGLVFEAPAVVGTVITETFNTADSDTLGPDLTWTELVGNHFLIVSNKAEDKDGNATAYARAEADLASDDHYVQADVTFEHDNARTGGVAARFSASAGTFYGGIGRAFDDLIRIDKMEADIPTILASTAKTIAAETLTVRFEVDGSTLDLDVGGTPLITTDTAITGNTRTGLYTFIGTINDQGHKWDNFEAGDLTGAVSGQGSANLVLTASASGNAGGPPPLGSSLPVFPALIFEAAFGVLPGVVPTLSEWTDLTSRLRASPGGIRWDVGRQNELDRMEAGTGTVHLDNLDRAFDPTNEASPYYPNIRPMTRVRSYVGSVLNQINNPGFETGALSPHAVFDDAGGSANWAVIENAGIARTGTWVLRHDASGLTGNTRLQFNGLETAGPGPHIPVEAGQQVFGRFYARSGSATAANKIRMRAEFFNASAVHLGGTGGAWLLPTTGDWEGELVTVTAPAGAVYVVFDVEIENSGNPEDIIYFDDVEGNVVYPVFEGFVESWPQTWPERVDAVVPITIVDGFKLLSMARTSVAYAQERSGHRVGALLDAAGWSAERRVIDVGQSEVQAYTASDRIVLNATRDTAETESGIFFIDPSGNAVFRDRLGRILAESQATFGDEDPELRYHDLVPSYDDDNLWNDIPVKGEGLSVQRAEDSTSQLTYGHRQLAEFGALVTTEAEASDLAHWTLRRYKNPRLRVDRIVIQGHKSEDLMTQILARQIGDRITVRRRPPGGGAVLETEVFIEHVSHDIGQTTWTTTWQLSPAFSETVWLIGVVGFSEIGVTTYVGFGAMLPPTPLVMSLVSVVDHAILCCFRWLRRTHARP